MSSLIRKYYFEEGYFEDGYFEFDVVSEIVRGPYVIASGAADNELLRALYDLVNHRWGNWNLTPYIAYLVDTVDASALPYLKEQFNVEMLSGLVGDDRSEETLRELIKNSIRLHKFMGTPFAIREACRAVGFPIIILQEGVASSPPDPATDWARFRVYVSTDNNRHVTDDMMRRIREFIGLYKPERSHLDHLGFFQELIDGPVFRPLEETSTNIYDGEYEYDGTIDYGGRKREVLELQIVGDITWYHTAIDSEGAFIYDEEGTFIAIYIGGYDMPLN